ncbi:MAG: hypothetical protein ACOC2H_01290 [Spirochaetota bacterium]
MCIWSPSAAIASLRLKRGVERAANVLHRRLACPFCINMNSYGMAECGVSTEEADMISDNSSDNYLDRRCDIG